MQQQLQRVSSDSTQLQLVSGYDQPVRLPPHSQEIEQAFLGALLLDNRLQEKVSEFLLPIHFFVPVHGRIYEHAVRLMERGQAASLVTMRDFFLHDADLVSIGGVNYLADLTAAVVSIGDADHYARRIYEHYIRRQLIRLGDEMAGKAYQVTLENSPQEQIEEAEKKLYDLASEGEFDGGPVIFAKALAGALHTAEAAFKRNSPISGVTSGFVDIDRKLGGLHPSDLLILAGRPSMGKTALATNIAYHAARIYAESAGKEGGKVVFFSLEMSSEQLALRILADVASVASEKIRRGEMSSAEFERLVVGGQKLAGIPLFIDDTPALTVGAVRTRARRLKRQQGLDMIVIDYLQLLRGSSASSENRVLEVSEITRGLKALAKELDVPVIALSQLSRAVESRDDKRPQLSDLRESGAIEQDADVVMFVFREEYYIERDQPTQLKDETQDKFNDRYQRWQERLAMVHATAELIIGKQRHGPIGTVKLYFDGQFTRFGDLDNIHQ
ncbi:MAG: replicative DNA helicase [Alphaproteobacteria bacterium]